MKYALLDSGQGKRLEQFGKYTLVRPCGHAAWNPSLDEAAWKAADATFSRTPKMEWKWQRSPPPSWETEIDNLVFRITPTEFGHIGLFPEHQIVWKKLEEETKLFPKMRFLNLFGYSGAATLFAARAGATVCHVDAAKGMVDWARENAQRNGLAQSPIRWIVDDARKFLQREIRRERKYDGILLDPPTFGRGTKGETFLIERDLLFLLELCCSLLSEEARFLILTSHTPGYSSLVLKHVLEQALAPKGGSVSSGEMVIPAPSPAFPLPNGFFAEWRTS